MTLLNSPAGCPRPAKARRAHPDRCAFSLPHLCALAYALLLGACAVVPITPQTISGKDESEGQPEGMWKGG